MIYVIIGIAEKVCTQRSTSSPMKEPDAIGACHFRALGVLKIHGNGKWERYFEKLSLQVVINPGKALI